MVSNREEKAGMIIAAVVLYAAVALYLWRRGVDLPRIVRIVKMGLAGGLAGAVVLGLAGWFVIVLPCAMVALLVSAAYYARSEILRSITPAGIILLNVAGNLAPVDAPMALNFAWIASLLPLPSGTLRQALDLAILYSPSLAALVLMVRGPPGNPALRYVLGVWVCWVGIAAVAGPGWSMLSDFRADQAGDWLAAAFVAFAALHVTMLALNVAISLGDDYDGARSIARSVRVDAMTPWIAAAIGAAFWIAAYLSLGLPIRDELKATLIFAAAFGAGAAIAAHRAPFAPTLDSVSRGSMGQAGTLVFCVALVGGIAYWLSSHGVGLSRTPVDAMTGQVAAPKTSAKVDLPRGRHIRMRPTDEAFGAWLTRRNIRWEVVNDGKDDYLVWADGPQHSRLRESFLQYEKAPWLGIDFHSVNRAAYGALPGVPRNSAAFETRDQSARFTTWLDVHGVKSQIVVSREGQRFVNWFGADDLLEKYVDDMRRECRAQRREDC